MFRRQKIVLCLGSSCFARGNQELIPVIRRYINRKQLEDKVDFKGDHCFDNCSNGPNIMIGTRLFQGVTVNNIEKILDEGLSEIA